jgi:hypothetical protein
MQKSSFYAVLEVFTHGAITQGFAGRRHRAALSQPGRERHLGTVTEVTATSISVHIDGLFRPKQFIFSRKRQWFSERGHVVPIERIPSQTAGARAQAP